MTDPCGTPLVTGLHDELLPFKHILAEETAVLDETAVSSANILCIGRLTIHYLYDILITTLVSHSDRSIISGQTTNTPLTLDKKSNNR